MLILSHPKDPYRKVHDDYSVCYPKKIIICSFLLISLSHTITILPNLSSHVAGNVATFEISYKKAKVSHNSRLNKVCTF